MKPRYYVTFVAVLFCSAGCTLGSVTFHSQQLAFLNEYVLGKIDKGPEPKWELHWLGEVRLVYAINVGDQILFANKKGDLLRFIDRQIREVRNLLPEDKIVEIRRNNSDLEYRIDEKFITKHLCTPWHVDRSGSFMTSETKYTQRCQGKKGKYDNWYVTNDKRQITRLTFTIYPDYPPVFLNIR